MPAISADGRTYTFRIRSGHALLAAVRRGASTRSAFKHTIERTLSPKAGPDPAALHTFGDVVGARAFHAGRAPHVSGIVARGDRLSITLRRPAGDLLVAAGHADLLRRPGRHAAARPGATGRSPRPGPYYVRSADGRADRARAQPELPRRPARAARRGSST